MKKKLLSIFIPIIMMAVVALGVILPTSLADRKEAANNNATYAEDTGASTADKSKKGGAIFLAEGVSYTMKGGKIEGKKKKYGGAVYVSKDATFTLDGGTITGCQAKYGGAIYVANGGHCIIKSGTVNLNKSESGPAIYVETGGDLQVIEGDIDNNLQEDWPVVAVVSEDTIEVGQKEKGIQLHYLYLGTYPQTYVGDELNDTLESWYTSTTPAKVQDYVNKAYSDATGNKNRTFTSYKYIDGKLYARGTSYRNSNGSSYTYKDNSTVKATGETAWFKVEPIKWIVLNYEEYQEGKPLEILAEELITSNIQFNKSTSDGNDWNNSWIRSWLNNEFINSAFNSEEKDAIQSVHLKNNITSGYAQSPDNTHYWPVDKETDDKIYLFTYYELSSSERGNLLGGYSNASYRVCSPTDYALSNYSSVAISSGYYTNNNRLGTTDWWLRSGGENKSRAMRVTNGGSIDSFGTVAYSDRGIRPALRLAL